MKTFTIDAACLYAGTEFKTTDITSADGKVKAYTVGTTIRSTAALKGVSRKGVAKHNYGILVYSDWQKDNLTVFTNPEKTQIYAEINPDWCADGDGNMFSESIFADKTGDFEWTVTFSTAPPSHIRGYVLALIGGVVLDLFKEKVTVEESGAMSTRDNSVSLFCDAIYYNFVVSHDIEGVVSSEEEVASWFAASTDMSLMDGMSAGFDTVESTLDDIEIDGYWTWGSCVKGEHRVDYDWAPEAIEHIPPLSTLDRFVPTPEFISMLTLVEQSLGRIKSRIDKGLTGEDALGDDVVNLKLSGPPGSGKSFALKCLAAVLGMPFWVTSFNPNSDESFAEGKTRMVGAEPRHTDAPLTMCQMYGGISAGEEPNTGDPEMIFGVYSQIVESPYILYRNGCEAIVRHPLSVYAILYNKNCGSATMHAALLNRFNQPFKFEPAAKDVFVKMLLKKADSSAADTTDIDKLYNEYAVRRKAFKATPKKLCNWVYDAYARVMNSLDSSSGRDAAEAISLRSCFGVIQAVQAGEDPYNALRCLTDNIGDFDEELETSTAKALKDTLRAL